jgi:surface antigen
LIERFNLVLAGHGLASPRVFAGAALGMQKKIWAVAVIAAPFLAGCVSFESDIPSGALPPEPHRNMVKESSQKPQQCVPFARDHSDVKIYGDAWTWWDQAAGKFQRGSLPESGAVMVLTGYAGPQRGHLAVVQQIISPREIRVDHANWLDDGSIYLNDPVADVSEDNDWSEVRVWNIRTGAWGGNIYPVQGFILPNQPDDQRIAQVGINHDRQ